MKRRSIDGKLRRAFGIPDAGGEEVVGDTDRVAGGGGESSDDAVGRGDPEEDGRGVPSRGARPRWDRESLARSSGTSSADSRGVRAFLQKRRKERAAVTLPDGGEVLSSEAGECFLMRQEYAPGFVHGGRSLPCAGELDWAQVAQLAKSETFEDVDLQDCLFLDTETTGLSGGVGTTVFMTGLGFYEPDGRFVTEQVFLRSFGDEPAKLAHVAKRLQERPVQVTFVGKAFDRHRLATRMTLHGVDAPILDPRHLDLYYLARRSWKDELPNVRLQTVERAKLGFHRENDMPGSEAPQAFLDWVRDGSGRIDRVFEHNRLDVLSLAVLLGVLGERST